MKIRSVVLFLTLLLSLGVLCNAQATDAPKMTEQERIDLREFTKGFVSKLNKTRDVRPLIADYFITDHETFVYYYFYLAGGEKIETRNPEEQRRFAMAMENEMVVMAPYSVIGLDSAKHLPAGLRRRYGRLMTALESDDNANPPKQRKLIPRIEEFSHFALTFLRKHPVEETAEYRKGLKKRESIDDYNYSISEDVPDSKPDNPTANWLRLHPDSRTYMVGTPVGLGIGVMRTNGAYKVLYIMPWPISYDPRIGD